MAYEESLHSITLDADSSIAVYTGVAGTLGSPSNPSGLQYRFVILTGEHTAGLAATANLASVIGVLQNKPQNTGDSATIGIYGISKVECAAAVAAGAALENDNVGRCLTQTSTNPILGYAIHSTAAAGQLVSVLLRLK